MELLKGMCLLAAGFVLLVKGADVFVDGASGLARRMGIPSLVVGLTVVAMGTSAPEAAVSISSSLKAASGIAIGNVFGSNIINVLVILGVTAAIIEVPVESSTLKVELPFTMLISVVLLALCEHDGLLGRVDAILLLALFAVYLVYTVLLALHGKEGEDERGREERPYWRLLVLIVAGSVGIVVGSNFVVDGATGVARIFGVSDRVIGLTIVALGTSLPEFVTSVTAARRGEAGISIGNVVGSNIFNILFVLGLSGAISPIPFDRSFLFDGILAAAAAVMLWVSCIRTRSIRRPWGFAMILAYAVYLGFLIVG